MYTKILIRVTGLAFVGALSMAPAHAEAWSPDRGSHVASSAKDHTFVVENRMCKNNIAYGNYWGRKDRRLEVKGCGARPVLKLGKKVVGTHRACNELPFKRDSCSGWKNS